MKRLNNNLIELTLSIQGWLDNIQEEYSQLSAKDKKKLAGYVYNSGLKLDTFSGGEHLYKDTPLVASSEEIVKAFRQLRLTICGDKSEPEDFKSRFSEYL